SGGTIGSGGATGKGGTTGTGGSTGTGGAAGAGGATATFTQVYAVLMANCSGSSCHSPGNQGNVSFASQSSAYSAVKSRVTAGNATGSSFYKLVNGGGMPPGGGLTGTNLTTIANWINA